jgi:acyl-[acyl-carrier-protein] desaturase
VSIQALFAEAEPTAAGLVHRHYATTKEWFPHEFVPYHRARDFTPGVAWSEGDADLAGAKLSPAMRSALFVNLLTEDNLPYYFRDVERMFGTDGAYGEWGRRWTAEEGRHSIVIRDYLTVSRAIDPVELERGRMTQVSRGETPSPPNPLAGVIYLTLQELATRVAHRNTGRDLGDPVGYEIMARVATDENLHFLFYRDLATAIIEMDPSAAIIQMEEVVRTFTMPGTGIPDFDRHAAAIAQAGIYNLLQHHDLVLAPVVLRHWKVEELTGLTPEADKARDQMVRHIKRVQRLGQRVADRQASAVTTS